jgi:hypothetical protein
MDSTAFLREYHKTKNPDCFHNRDLKVASTYSPTFKKAVPSAQAGLTSLFGMGRGGPCRNRHLKSLNSLIFLDISDDRSKTILTTEKGYKSTGN